MHKIFSEKILLIGFNVFYLQRKYFANPIKRIAYETSYQEGENHHGLLLDIWAHVHTRINLLMKSRNSNSHERILYIHIKGGIAYGGVRVAVPSAAAT